MTAAILVLALALAAANGANDVPKTVATLGGAGVTRYRTAIAWGAMTTLLGLNGRTLRDFAIAWTVTPVSAALVAAAVFALLR